MTNEQPERLISADKEMKKRGDGKIFLSFDFPIFTAAKHFLDIHIKYDIC